jgi:DNA-binding LytR/AlgR family response regulator
MNCIIVDDEPLAREGMLSQLQDMVRLKVVGIFNSAKKAGNFMRDHSVDLVFLDIQMRGISGLEFAATIPKHTLVIFTTAFSRYALESYEVDAIDYLVKPVIKERLERAISKALAYHELLQKQETTTGSLETDSIVIRADRRYQKIFFKHILYIEGLKDYVVIYIEDGSKIITAMNIKTIHGHLDSRNFARVGKSYLVNINHIDSFDSHTVYIKDVEIAIGDVFRKEFLEIYFKKETLQKK